MRREITALGRAARAAAAVVTRRPMPLTVSFILTHRCNFRCRYCDIPAAAGDELTAAELTRAVDELFDRGLLRASFSGGEALLRSDAIDVIAHAHGRGLYTSLNSNGWTTARDMESLAPHLDMLVLSLDGPPAVHDTVRRKPGSAARVLEAVDAARARGLSVATITVLGPWNLDHVEDVLDLAEHHGFASYFQPAYDDCFALRRGLHPVFDARVFDRIASQLDNARARGRPVASSAAYTSRLRRGPDFGDCTHCAAGRYFATLMPDGTWVPCHLTSRDQTYPNGRVLGFARAFDALPRPLPGAGCAIAPYQETDLIAGLDRSALAQALRRMVAPRRQRIASAAKSISALAPAPAPARSPCAQPTPAGSAAHVRSTAPDEDPIASGSRAARARPAGRRSGP
jgi:MoaA/NifB/PqqE/SkfB family radical SAM enzyme